MIRWLGLSALLICSCASQTRRSTQNPDKPAAPVAVMAPRQAVPQNTPEALIAAGHKAFQKKDYNRAFDFYISASEGLKGTPKLFEAQLWTVRTSVRLGRWPETAQLTESLLNSKTLAAPQRLEVMNYEIRALEALGDQLKLLGTLQRGLQDPELAQEHETFRMKSSEVVESKMNQGELESVLDSKWPDPLRAQAAYRLGEIALEAKDASEAKSLFQKSRSLAPQTEIARRADDLLAQLETLNKVEPKTIGVVLPLTGRHSAVAQKTLRGIQMGLGLSGKNITSFRLAVVDSEGNPDKARQGVERLVREDNVIAVIGSVLSRTAPGVASKSAELGIPSLALSQKAGITDVGPSVHRNSLTSEMQVRWLVKQAMEEMGLRKFAILFPNDAYGVEFSNIFWDEVLARGGQITAAQVYSPKETDFRNVIQRLVAISPVDARADEYRLRMKEKKDNQPKSVRNENQDNPLPPIVDFDAIFIPDSIKSLGQIAAMLSFNDVKGVKLLGTNLWNTPGLAKRAGLWSKDLLFVDSFVTTDPSYQSSAFVREYKATFGEEPGIFELQGYDSALILRQLISQGATTRDSLSRSLSQLREVPGALARLSVGPDREIQRPLVALTLENGQIVPFRRNTAP